MKQVLYKGHIKISENIRWICKSPILKIIFPDESLFTRYVKL